jgi:hypothetical protein
MVDEKIIFGRLARTRPVPIATETRMPMAKNEKSEQQCSRHREHFPRHEHLPTDEPLKKSQERERELAGE